MLQCKQYIIYYRKAFNELAYENEAVNPSIDVTKTLEGCEYDTAVIFGVQNISKFNTEQYSRVEIYLGIVRIAGHNTDVLISMNHTNGQNLTLEVFERILLSFKVKDPSLFVN